MHVLVNQLHRTFVIFLTLCAFLYMSFTHFLIAHAQDAIAPVTYSTDISVQVGTDIEYYSLFGYTSSFATVTLDAFGLSEKTNADQNGYYEFINFAAPRSTKEFCLTTIDTEQLTAPPLCIATPPAKLGEKFGPFLLPPTIQIQQTEAGLGTETKVVGKTIPGTSVTLIQFSQNLTSRGFIEPISTVYAQAPALKSGKNIITSSASDGSFTTNIVTPQAQKVRLFAQSTFLKQKTPKSVTLTFETGTLVGLLIFYLLAGLKQLLYPLVLLAAFAGLLYIYRKRAFILIKFRKKPVSIMLAPYKGIIKYENSAEIQNFRQSEVTTYTKPELIENNVNTLTHLDTID